MMWKTGSFYTLYYTNWKTNQKIYAFILYGGLAGDKVHALNLGAIQLSIYDRYKLINTIKKLMKIPNSNKFDGAMLYQILKRYNLLEIQKCYRTYHKNMISGSALINYGLNHPEDFSELELKYQNQALYNQATNSYIIKLMNFYTGSGVQKLATEAALATPQQPNTSTTTPSGTTSKPTNAPTNTPTNSTTAPNTGTAKPTTGQTVTGTQPKPNSTPPKNNNGGNNNGGLPGFN